MMSANSFIIYRKRNMNQTEILKELKEKYESIGQNVDTHLSGLLHSKPITYWDYVHTDSLLNLQIQRTN